MPPLPFKEFKNNAVEATAPDAGDKPRGFLTKVAKTIDKGHRWYLERDEPDAAGRWDDDHRRSMLRYVYDRDGGRCGLCTAEMKIKGAQIEHVVPKVFVLFDVGKGRQGRAGHSLQEPPAQDRQPPGRPHLLQQAQGQHPGSRQVAAPGHAAAHRRRHRGRRSPRAATGVEDMIRALTPGNRQHSRSVLAAAARWRVAAGSIGARARSNPRSRHACCASSLLRCDSK